MAFSPRDLFSEGKQDVDDPYTVCLSCFCFGDVPVKVAFLAVLASRLMGRESLSRGSGTAGGGDKVGQMSEIRSINDYEGMLSTLGPLNVARPRRSCVGCVW